MRDPRYNGIDDSIKDQAYADAVRQERESLTQEAIEKAVVKVNKLWRENPELFTIKSVHT